MNFYLNLLVSFDFQIERKLVGSFGKEFNWNESQSFQNIFPNQSEKCFVSCLMKIGQKSIRLNSIIPLKIEASIRMNPSCSNLRLIWIENWV